MRYTWAEIYQQALDDMASELWAVSQTPYIQEWADMDPDEIVRTFVKDAEKKLEGS